MFVLCQIIHNLLFCVFRVAHKHVLDHGERHVAALDQERQVLLTWWFVLDQDQQDVQTQSCEGLKLAVLVYSGKVRDPVAAHVVGDHGVDQRDE